MIGQFQRMSSKIVLEIFMTVSHLWGSKTVVLQNITDLRLYIKRLELYISQDKP